MGYIAVWDVDINMRRRPFLLSVPTTLSGVAGCMSRGQIATSPTPSRKNSPRAINTEHCAATVDLVHPDSSLTVAGEDMPAWPNRKKVCVKDNFIPAVTEPKLGPDWSDIEGKTLAEDDLIIGVNRGGFQRAYPLRSFNEVVNDTLDVPIVVTFCPLCGSSIAAKRVVSGEPSQFVVSGLLWKRDLVMYDTVSGSLWSQIAATAIRGPLLGEELTLVPSTLTTWQEWKNRHANTKVLLPTSKTVEGKAVGARPPVTTNASSEIVIGITSKGNSKAYPRSVVKEEGIINDWVGELPVVVTIGANEKTLYAYNRELNGTVLTFEKTNEKVIQADGSRWQIHSGEAVTGPHNGVGLQPATKRPQMYEYAWQSFHPETKIYGT
jgi:hypothetical protein